MIGNGRGRTFAFLIVDVLASLKKHRKVHAADVDKAKKAYRKKATAKLKKMHQDAVKGKPIETHIGMSIPLNYLNVYDNAIDILTDTQKTGALNIELTAEEYERFVKDRWEWTASFEASNSAYLAKFRALG